MTRAHLSAFERLRKNTTFNALSQDFANYAYDVAGREIAQTDPLGQMTTMGYDVANRQTLNWSPRDIRTTLSYDATGRLIGEVYPSDLRHTYTFDAAGRRTAMADATGISNTTYTPRGEVASAANADDKIVTYSYDPTGRRESLTDADGGIFTYGYDAAGQQVLQIDPRSKITTLAYNAVGQCVMKQLPNGSLVTHAYDVARNLTEIINAKSDGSLVSRFTYTYDNVGNRTSELSQAGERKVWGYDETYQLTSEGAGAAGWLDFELNDWLGFTVDDWLGFELEGGSGEATIYAYDGVGNRLAKTAADAVTTYTYDAANELLTEENAAGVTTYTYDEAGNRTEKESPSETTYYTWDEVGRMSAAEPPAGITSLTYNADSQRVEKKTPTETKKFIYDFRKVLQETDGNDATQREFTFTNNSEYGDLVSEHDELTDTDAYPAYDAQWSTNALIDDNESVTDKYKYTAFGLQTHETGTSESPFTFVGKQSYWNDLEISLYMLGIGGKPHSTAPSEKKNGGIYDPTNGQFIRRDPLQSDPLGNDYNYARNNPINKIDPSGQESLNDILDEVTGEDEIHDFRESFDADSTLDIIGGATDLKDAPPEGTVSDEPFTELLGIPYNPNAGKRLVYVPTYSHDGTISGFAEKYVEPPPGKRRKPWGAREFKQCICAMLDAPGQEVEALAQAVPEMWKLLTDKRGRVQALKDILKSLGELYRTILTGGKEGILAAIKVVLPYTGEMMERILETGFGEFVLDDPKGFCRLLILSVLEITFWILDGWLLAPIKFVASTITSFAKIIAFLLKKGFTLAAGVRKKLTQALFRVASGQALRRIAFKNGARGIEPIVDKGVTISWTMKTKSGKSLLLLPDGSGAFCGSPCEWLDDVIDFVRKNPDDFGGEVPFSFAPKWTVKDFPAVGAKTSQKQLRHIKGRPEYRGGGFFDNVAGAQKVLDDFNAGSATIIGKTRQGFPVVRVEGVTGTNVNISAGFPNQPTNVFIIKGTKSPSVVPANPNWGG